MSDRLVFSGTTVMAACACGTSSGVASLVSQSGLHTHAGVMYPLIVGTGAVLTLLAGAIVAYPIETGVEKLVPSLSVGGANLTFVLRYPLWLLGTGLMLFAASRALFPYARSRASEPALARTVATA